MLLRRDVDYIVRSGRIEIVDEFTGRVVADRHWPDGLQAALEAKEGLERRPDGRILGSMTLQRFLRGYPRLCGMTGTATSCAAELRAVVRARRRRHSTARPMVRIDRDDLVFTDREAKERAIVDEIARAHATGRPVLVGTSTVTESERLAARLRAVGVRCEVLNAKNDAEEAAIVARAGAVRRGHDLDEHGRSGHRHPPRGRRADRCVALGGLYVIGTNRHESRRVDLQLRGRAGRQGDPGESRFFVSLDDELLVRYGIHGLIPARLFPETSDAPIESPVVRREVARAQRIVEGQNFEIRRTLARYAAVVEEQHRQLMERRHAMLVGDAQPDIWQTRARAPGRRWSRRVGEPRSSRQNARSPWSASIAHGAIISRSAPTCARASISFGLAVSDPLTQFTSQAIAAFSQIDDAIDEAVLAALALVRIDGSVLDLTATGLKGPSSTWTYLVNDDPFKSRIGALLTGPGGATVAMYSAAVMMPLLVAWGLVDSFFRRSRRRSEPFK